MVFQKCHSWPPNNRCHWCQGSCLSQITKVTSDLFYARRRKQANTIILSMKKLDCEYEACSSSLTPLIDPWFWGKRKPGSGWEAPRKKQRLAGTKCVCNPVSIFSSAIIHHLPSKASKVLGLCWKEEKCEWHPCQLALEVGGSKGLYLLPELGCTVASFKTGLENQS